MTTGTGGSGNPPPPIAPSTRQPSWPPAATSQPPSSFGYPPSSFGYPPPPPPPPPPPSGPTWKPIAFLVAIVLVLLTGLGLQRYASLHRFDEIQPAPVATGAQPDGRRLPAVEATTSGRYAFLHTLPSGQPVSYNPCRPITWFLNPDQAPPGSERLIREAIGDVSARTGLQFVDGGLTDLRPDSTPAQRVVGTLIIGWASEDEEEELRGSTVGFGGSSSHTPGGPATAQLYAGSVVLDTELAEDLQQKHGEDEVRLIMMHELAHVIGLDHVDDKKELMHPQYGLQTGWGAGDLQGLALLGQGSCD